MAPEAIASEARRRSDEAVRRLREESRRRLDRETRWRAFSSWCALATLASGISLGALAARDVRVRQASEQREALIEAGPAHHDVACAEVVAKRHAIRKDLYRGLARARSEEEQARLRATALTLLDAAWHAGPGGCSEPGAAALTLTTVPAVPKGTLDDPLIGLR